MSKVSDQYRQGDVFIEAIVTVPTSAVEVSLKPGQDIVLAEGEATGHAHRIPGTPQVRFFQNPKNKMQTFLRVLPGGKAPVALNHEEHAPITIPPGDYVVNRQREYQPGELPRYVAD